MLRAPMPGNRLLTPAFVFCFLANLAQGVAFHMFLHLPGFLSGLGASAVEVGWIFGLAALTAVAARPRIGEVMDRRGRRRVILAGNALHVAAVGLYLGIDSVGPAVYAVRIAHGLAEALLFTALFTFAADHVPEERRTQGLALFGVSGMLPISLGGALGDAVLARGSYADLFVVALVLAALAGLLSLPLRDAPAEERAEAPPRRGFRASLLQPDLMPMWWIGLVFTTALNAVFTFLKLFVEETGTGSVGGFFSAYAFTAITLRVTFGWVPDRVGPKRVLVPALLVLASGFALLGEAGADATVWAAGFLCGLGHGYTFPILFSLVVGRARPADRGSAMAIYTGLFDLGILLGGPLLGWVIEVGGFAAMFRAAAAMVVAGVLSFAWWDRGRR